MTFTTKVTMSKNKKTDSKKEHYIRQGIFLKKKRQQAKLSQAEVAEKLGYGGPQFISNIERGVSSVPLEKLGEMAELYKISKRQMAEFIIENSRIELYKKFCIPYDPPYSSLEKEALKRSKC